MGDDKPNYFDRLFKKRDQRIQDLKNLGIESAEPNQLKGVSIGNKDVDLLIRKLKKLDKLENKGG